MAKLKNRFKYLLTLVVPFIGTALIAQDAPAPKSGGNAEEAKGTLSAGAIAAAFSPPRGYSDRKLRDVVVVRESHER